MSTGAWIFASVIAASVIAPTAVYAAATSTVAIGNTNNSLTATVTANHQLLTTTVAPKDIVHGTGAASDGNCNPVYVPPAGKAIVVTSVTYDMYLGPAGNSSFAYLQDVGCGGASYDIIDTDRAEETQSHTFPIGLPMPSVAISSGSHVLVYFTGYLIPATQLPAAGPATKLPTRLHATH